MRRAPTVVVALCVAVVELVLLAAAGNQWIVDHLIKNATTSELPRDSELKATLTAFPWRFAPQGHLRMLWLGEIVADVGMIIVVFLLVYALVAPMRMPRRFVPVFLGTWGIVVGVTQVAAIGRALLAYGDVFDNGRDPDRLGRYWYSVFEGPTGETVLFGGVSGLIVAIVAGIVASVSSRRAEEAEEEAGLDRGAAWSGVTSAAGSPALVGSQAGSQPGDTVVERSWNTPIGADEPAPAQRPPWPPAEAGAATWSQPVESRPGPHPGSHPASQWPHPAEPTSEMPRGGEPPFEATRPRDLFLPRSGGEATARMSRPPAEPTGTGFPPSEERPPGSPGSPEPPALP